jgi:Putative zinc-finger
MDCRTVHDHLSIYLDHDVPLQMRLVLDQHLESCPKCCHELTRLHAITTLVRDFPLIEPPPMFLQHIREQVERMSHRARPSFFRRLTGALPLQVAAAVVVVVGAALVWQMTPHLRQGQVQEVDPPAHIEPWLSREHSVAPMFDAPPFEPMPEESLPTPAPLVQASPRWAGFMAQDEFVRVGHEFPAMLRLTGMAAGGRVGEVAFFPSLTLRASDPVQAAQQIWELVPRTGGELLQSQGMITPANHTSRGVVGLTLSITADRYQPFLEAIRQLSGTTVIEERIAIIGRELPQVSSGSPWRVEHSQVAKTPPMTLVITILRR